MRDSEAERLKAALVQMASDQGPTIDQFAAPPGYAHLPLAIIDSVYSLRSPYKVAQNAVSAYCEHVGINDRGDADSIDVDERSIDDFLEDTGGMSSDGLVQFFGGARNTAPGTTKLKADACVEAARGLRRAEVNVRADLQDSGRVALAKTNWRAVKGLGQQSWSYFTMLAGVEDWKVDTWVKRFVDDAVGRTVAATEGRALLDAAIERLERDESVRLSKRAIDHAIWRSASGRPPRP